MVMPCQRTFRSASNTLVTVQEGHIISREDFGVCGGTGISICNKKRWLQFLFTEENLKPLDLEIEIRMFTVPIRCNQPNAYEHQACSHHELWPHKMDCVDILASPENPEVLLALQTDKIHVHECYQLRLIIVGEKIILVPWMNRLCTGQILSPSTKGMRLWKLSFVDTERQPCFSLNVVCGITLTHTWVKTTIEGQKKVS